MYLVILSNRNFIFDFNIGYHIVKYRLELDDKTNRPKCVCPFFSAKYTDGNCYQEYTRGPCPFGRLIVLDKELGEGKCVCNPEQAS